MRILLNKKQRKILTGLLEKFAVVSGTAWVFGQFIPGQRGSLKVAISGIVIALILSFLAIILNRRINKSE